MRLFIPMIRSVTMCDLCVSSSKFLCRELTVDHWMPPQGWRVKKRRRNTGSSAGISGGKCAHEGKGYTDTVSLDVQDKPRARCATVTVRSLLWYQTSLQLFRVFHGGWPWVVWLPPLAVSTYCGVTGIVLVFSLSSPCPPPSGALRSSNFPFSLYQILPMSAPSLINVKSQSVQQGLYSSTAPSALIHPIVPKNWFRWQENSRCST